MVKTSGANSASFPTWDGEEIVLTDLYDEISEYRYSCLEPEISFECKEFVLNWIRKQQKIRGCVFNLNDGDIIEALADKDVLIVVNWNPDFNAKKDIYSLAYSKITCRHTGNTFDSSGTRKYVTDKIVPGVKVFFHQEEGRKFPSNMHHKFLVGWEESNNDDSRTLIYGTFNMSTYTPLSLDSVLLFRQNQRLIGAFQRLQEKLHKMSIVWPWVERWGIEEALQKAKQAKRCQKNI